MKEFLDQPNNENEKQLKVLEKILGKDLFQLKLKESREKRLQIIQFLDLLFESVLEKINPLQLDLNNLKKHLDIELQDLKSISNNLEEIENKEWEINFVKGQIELEKEKLKRKSPLAYEDLND
jgi:hypothetical protein